MLRLLFSPVLKAEAVFPRMCPDSLCLCRKKDNKTRQHKREKKDKTKESEGLRLGTQQFENKIKSSIFRKEKKEEGKGIYIFKSSRCLRNSMPVTILSFLLLSKVSACSLKRLDGYFLHQISTRSSPVAPQLTFSGGIMLQMHITARMAFPKNPGPTIVPHLLLRMLRKR
jgi:hypothetical protein